MEKQQLVIRVYGKVQGVWFRQSTKDMADNLGICGTVNNEPDGSVYIIAQGSEEQLREFLVFCNEGSPEARVENVIVQEDSTASFNDFSIIR